MHLRMALCFCVLLLPACSDSEETCAYAGRVYRSGETFPSTDGCNTCTCDGRLGAVSCTEKACAPRDGGVAEAGSREAGACSKGAATPLGRICVRGEATPSGEETLSQGTVRVQVYPHGCFSSSCTARHDQTCTVTGSASPFTLASLFCLEDTSVAGGGCTSDCSGGGLAECSTPALTAGSHTISAGTISLTFTVPSTVPGGGLCAGAQF